MSESKQTNSTKSWGKEMFNGTVALSILTALVYVINLNYLSAYYDYFGLSVVDMNYSLIQVLSSDFFLLQVVILILFLVHSITVHKHDFFTRTFDESGFALRTTIAIIIMIITTAYLGGKAAAWMRLHDPNRKATVVVNDQTITGYNFLCTNGDRLYLVKVEPKGSSTKSFKLSDVSSFTVGP